MAFMSEVIDAVSAAHAIDPSQLWSPCAGGTEVEFVVIEGASHAWPGGNGGTERLVGPTYEGYDASAELWSFLSGHPRPDH